MVFFFKRDAKLALNEVNSGNLQYAASTLGDYEAYQVGQAIVIEDHLGNPILDGYIKDKTRTNGIITSLYIEDAGQFLRDYNVEDNAPEDGEPVFDTVRNVLQNYILPASWSLDTSAMDDTTMLEWPVGYAVRNGTALKHVNNICDMLSLRWVAKWQSNLQTFALQLYSLIPPASVAASDADLTEFRTTAAFSGGDNSRHFITQTQIVGGESEVGQQTAFSQADTLEWGYLASSDTYCRSLDLSPGTTIVGVMHGDLISGWDTSVSTIFKFAHDDAWYTYDFYDGNEVRGIISHSMAPWATLDPATVAAGGLAIGHATNDEMFIVGALVADRELVFPYGCASPYIPPTTWMWVGSEVVSFATASNDGSKTTFASITRGLNGVRYIHRQGAKIRPYYPSTIGGETYPDAPLFKTGGLSTSISMSGFIETDGLDKVADGILKAATIMYTGSSQKLVATLNINNFHPGKWVNTTPASVLQSGTLTVSATDVPPISLVKSVSYSLGSIVKVEFGTNIPTVVRNSKEAVTAFDLVMQRPPQSKAGEVVELSPNENVALMKFQKTNAERMKQEGTFDETDDTNYVSKWVRIK